MKKGVKSIITSDGSKGGMALGPSHDHNGIKTIIKQTGEIIEIEGNEPLLASESMAIKEKYVCEGTPKGVASAVNELGGGNSFSDDGSCRLADSSINKKGSSIKEKIKKDKPHVYVAPENGTIKVNAGSAIINKKNMSIKDKVRCYGNPETIASRVNEINGNGIRFSNGEGYCEFVDEYDKKRKGGKTKSNSKELLAPNGKPSNLTPEQYKIVRTKEFKNWFGDWEKDPENSSKVIDENGEPLVVYHGTTHKFTVFSTDRSNIENDFGKGYYFSSSSVDANVNYNEEGQDITNRIERLAERIQSEEDITEGKAKYKARKTLIGKESRVIDVFLNIRNPLVIGGDNETYLDFEYDPDEEIESGKLLEFLESLRSESMEYDEVRVEESISSILGNHIDGVQSSDLIDTLKESEAIAYAQDNDGNLAINEIIRASFEGMGYDGIIDNTVSKKWGMQSGRKNIMEGVDINTIHFIAFQPNQIKLADGSNATFNPNNPDIRYKNGGLHGLAYGKSLFDIATKHKASLSFIKDQIRRGVEVEKEHTGNIEISKRIAKDHLWEDPRYYIKLKRLHLSNGGETDFAHSEKNGIFIPNKITKDEIRDVLSGTREVINGDLIQSASNYLRRSKGSSAKIEESKFFKRKEAELLRPFIYSNNLWVARPNPKNEIGEGGEQKVYLSDPHHVVKVNSLAFYESWEEYFNGLLLHNYFFPSTAYELIGFIDNGSNVLPMVKQPFVVPTSQTHLNKVKEFMSDNGFVNKRRNDYENKELGIILENLHEENVVTKNGVLYFIDTVFYLDKYKYELKNRGGYMQTGGLSDPLGTSSCRVYLSSPPLKSKTNYQKDNSELFATGISTDPIHNHGYYDVDELNNLFKAFSIPITVTKKLGVGMHGEAYETSKGTVVKVTNNAEEAFANAILKIKEKDLESQAKVYNVFKFTDGRRTLYIIEKEKVRVLEDYILKLSPDGGKSKKEVDGMTDEDVAYYLNKTLDQFNEDPKGYREQAIKKKSTEIGALIARRLPGHRGNLGASSDKAVNDSLESIKDVFQRIKSPLTEEQLDKVKKIAQHHYDLYHRIIKDEDTTNLDMDDYHWGNIGFKDDKLVCFDCITGSKIGTYATGGKVKHGDKSDNNVKPQIGQIYKAKFMHKDRSPYTATVEAISKSGDGVYKRYLFKVIDGKTYQGGELKKKDDKFTLSIDNYKYQIKNKDLVPTKQPK